ELELGVARGVPKRGKLERRSAERHVPRCAERAETLHDAGSAAGELFSVEVGVDFRGHAAHGAYGQIAGAEAQMPARDVVTRRQAQADPRPAAESPMRKGQRARQRVEIEILSLRLDFDEVRTHPRGAG